MKTIDRKWWVLIAIGTGSFMSALDASVVNTILPILRTAFNSDVAAIEWVVTVYLLVLSGLLLSFGRLGDLRGHKSIYIWAFVIAGLSYISILGFVHLLMPKMTPLDDNLNYVNEKPPIPPRGA
jgi:MFS family permease